MPVPPTRNLKKRHKKSRALQDPETADEFLARGVEHEESAEKWRAGDAVKALRFYARAVEVYEGGLARWPQNVDLGYNRARIFFNISQYPSLLRESRQSKEALLSKALEAHRHVLNLDSSSVDTLFNAAQILVELAEVGLDEATALGDDSELPQQRAAGQLREAVDMLQRCLDLEEARVAQQREDVQRMMAAQRDDEDGGVSLAGTSDINVDAGGAADHGEDSDEAEDDGGQWASVVEGVTDDAMLDYIIAYLHALTTLLDIDAQNRGVELSKIEDLATAIALQRAPVYITDAATPDGRLQAVVGVARLKAAVLEARFRDGIESDFRGYDTRLKDSFVGVAEEYRQSSEWMCAYAESLVDFAAVVSTRAITDSAPMRWARLTRALDLFSQAFTASMAADSRKPPIAILTARGDVELLRHNMCRDPGLPGTVNNEQTRRLLLENARKFYNNACKLATSQPESGYDADDVAAAEVRSAAVEAMLSGDLKEINRLAARGEDPTSPLWPPGGLVRRMEAEGLIPGQVMESMLGPDVVMFQARQRAR